MASFTTVFIFIVAIIAIGGEAAIRSLTLPGPRVPNHEKTSDQRPYLTLIITDQDKFNMTWPLPLQDEMDVQTSPISDSKTFTGSTVDQHESQKDRGLKPVETTVAGGGSDTIMTSPIGSILPLNENDKEVHPPKLGVEYWRRLLESITGKGFRESVLKTRRRRSPEKTSSNKNGTAVVKQEMSPPEVRFKWKCFLAFARIMAFVNPSAECWQYFQDPRSEFS